MPFSLPALFMDLHKTWVVPSSAHIVSFSLCTRFFLEAFIRALILSKEIPSRAELTVQLYLTSPFIQQLLEDSVFLLILFQTHTNQVSAPHFVQTFIGSSMTIFAETSRASHSVYLSQWVTLLLVALSGLAFFTAALTSLAILSMSLAGSSSTSLWNDLSLGSLLFSTHTHILGDFV